MKIKSLNKVLILGVIALFLGFLVGCSNSIEDEIKRDYLKLMHAQGEIEMKLEDVKILENYGTYNGSVVVRIERGAYEVITEITVGEVEFIFSNTNIALVWHDGEFYELTEAYEMELLTTDDLVSIATKVNQ